MIDWLGWVPGVLFLALAVFALTRKPRAPAAVWFGLFVLGYAVRNIAGSGQVMFDLPIDVQWWGRAPAAILIAVSGAVLPFVFPSRVRSDEKRLVYVAATVALVLAAVYALTLWDRDFDRVSRRVFEYANVATAAAWLGALLLFALRFGGESDPASRRRFAVAGAAFALPIGYEAGWHVVRVSAASLDIGTVVGRVGFARLAEFVVFVGLSILWLKARSESRLGRAVSWLSLAVALGGAVTAALGHLPWNGVAALHFAMVAVLGYAIFEHRLLGIDVKLRWTISRSTVAASFVAVFFLVSEGAQILFGQENEVIGLLAAGALVFALAPLQRAADRLAEKAVPGAASSPPPALSASAEEHYREAVRLALRDRPLTRDEERHLLRLAHHAGIPPTRAIEIHDELERERLAA